MPKIRRSTTRESSPPYEMIQQHGGTIDVRSKPGNATAMLVRLPIHHPMAEDS
jgi:nitrogen-specific signal transduction histidine kinase